ncbi:MAG TPA: CCA tRNA nucleotidyltransferase [Actinomycetes bacterium]|nr:CCA tRNA nucleotidyltransferase [Actinomycetes bacterium]
MPNSATPPPHAQSERLDVAQRRAVAELLRVSPIADGLGTSFEAAGHEIALVGGSVRDALLGGLGADLDFATSAHPEQVETLVADLADAVWDIGRQFGTIGCRIGEFTCEITTYRSDQYDRESRKPEVAYGDTLEGDLKRRDFTVNAMAIRLPGQQFVDPFGGLRHLSARVLKTPAAPEDSFDDDPLRMLRAARFAAQLAFAVDEHVVTAMTTMAERITIVSAERVRDELIKLLMSDAPRVGIGLLVDTGLAEHILEELPALKLEVDEHHRHKDVYEHSLTVLEQAIDLERDGPDLTLRLAALLHDIGKPATRRFEAGGGVSFHHHEVVGARLAIKRMRALRLPRDLVDDVSRLIELHLRFHGYAEGGWTDSAVRRYVRDAGPLLSRLHQLTRADCTTRNKRKAAALSRAYDDLEQRIHVLATQEELDAIRPDLDGNEIMQILGVKPGKSVGDAYRFLLELRLDAGPQDKAAAADALRQWWAGRGESG